MRIKGKSMSESYQQILMFGTATENVKINRKQIIRSG